MSSFTVAALAALLACGLSGGCASRAGARPDLQQDQPAPAPVDARDDGGHKNYLLPVVEIVAMDAIVNRVGSLLLEPETFAVSGESIRRNLRGPWVVDDDPFEINQFGHPYQGAMYHGIARSNGLGFWPSLAYTFAGSALWEIAGETTQPSRNDQIASGIAGSFLGEPLYRISRLLLEAGDGHPGTMRTVAAVLASPTTGRNHFLVGKPAGSPSSDALPFSDIRVQIGATAVPTRHSPSGYSLAVDQPRVALSMDYGYPGNAGYVHERPFDYFRIESSVSSDGLEQVSTRGLLVGADYGAGRLAGVWGLYGTYDYFAPADFRLGSTAGAVGTTLQAAIADPLVLQTSALVGAGYAATHSEGAADDFNYGVAPQSVVNLRLIAGRRAALDVTARQYFISSVGGFGTGQRDLIFVGDAWLAIRIHGRHGIGLTYQRAGRTSDYLELPDKTRSQNTVGVYYTFLGTGGFGAVR
jgi:hypothetical protein